MLSMNPRGPRCKGDNPGLSGALCRVARGRRPCAVMISQGTTTHPTEAFNVSFSSALAGAVAPSRAALQDRFASIRARSLALAAPLSPEDQCVQPMPDASPTKWHLAHTSWFFEAVVLCAHRGGYKPYDRRFFHLFNSYYETLGPRHPRPQRGLLTRPSLDEVHAYRAHVDDAMLAFIAEADV